MKLNRLRAKSEAGRERHIPHSAFRIPHYLSPGFTLVELMAVIVIIGIVSGIVIAGAGYANKKALSSRTFATIHQVSAAIDMFYADRLGYPSDFGCFNEGETWSTPNPVYGSITGQQFVSPCESLWFWLEYNYPHMGPRYARQPYCVFKREQVMTGNTKINALYDNSPGNYMRIVDAWGNPLNYKSNNSWSYKFTTKFSPSDPNENMTLPRHNRTSYDICSFGSDGTTWQERDKPFDRQQDLKLDQFASVTDNNNPAHSGQIPNYFAKPFETITTSGSGIKHCYGGEDDNDLNNWQQR